MATAAQPAAASTSLVQRMIGAAKLNVHTFEEVENDPKATTQALTVVIIVSLASAIGAVLATIIGVGGIGNILSSAVFGIVRGIIVWIVWAFLTYILGTTLFKTPDTHANWGQLARSTGFAQSPGVLGALFFIPAVGPIIGMIAGIWQLVAMVIAVRQALDYKDTLRAVGVVVVAFLIVFIPLFLIGGALGIAGMGR